jgi:hypothetical protein
VDFYIAKAKVYERFRGRLNDRQEETIAPAENYMIITKTSRATTTRDLQDLVEKDDFGEGTAEAIQKNLRAIDRGASLKSRIQSGEKWVFNLGI